MVEISYEGASHPCEEGESVLKVLTRAGVNIPYSCEKGTCLTCLMKGVDGKIPKEAQKNLQLTLSEQGYFLACLCKPTSSLSVQLADDAVIFGRATVQRVDKVTADICRVIIRPSTPLYYRSGQFINIRRFDGLVRSYSIASVPRLDSDLEIHVKRMPSGKMSNWIYEDVNPGDELDLQGPNGECFYVPGQPEKEMLLIGTGTGLAPLFGVIRDALAAGHSGNVHLYHGSRNVEGHYLTDRVKALADKHGNFQYHPCVSGDDVPAGFRAARADVSAFEDHPSLDGFRVFICGYPAMVNDARKKAFMAGANLALIHADPFDFKDLRTTARDETLPRADVW